MQQACMATAVVLVLLGGGMSATASAAGIEHRAVQFAKGTSSATIKGSVKGDQTIDYTLRARAGQTMTVQLATTHGALGFNVLPPGSNDVAIFNSTVGGNDFKGTLEADGEYKLRVYLIRSAARRGEQAAYTLTVGITGAPQAAAAAAAAGAPAGGPDPIERAGGGRFDATGQMPCAQAAAQPMSTCAWGVARGGGQAALVITRPDGRKLMVFWERGRITGSDASQASGAFRVTRTGDLYRVQLGDERYEFPEAVFTGG